LYLSVLYYQYCYFFKNACFIPRYGVKIKVENAAERLKEGNLFLEASISAYDFTFARVRKRVAAAMCGIHTYLAQGVRFERKC
jgi:hypothetical protein